MTLKFEPFEQYQAQAPETIPLPSNYYEDGKETAVYWLSASGVLVNSHGCTIMIDPLLSIMSDDPAIGETAELLMTAPPIMATQVEKLDAVLYTHTDNDHLGPITAKELMKTGAQFHGTPYVISELSRLGLSVTRHNCAKSQSRPSTAAALSRVRAVGVNRSSRLTIIWRTPAGTSPRSGSA